MAAGTVLKETGFAFKSFCHRVEVAVVSCETHEDLKKDKDLAKGKAAGPKRLLNKAESLIEKHPKFFADEAYTDMLAKAQVKRHNLKRMLFLKCLLTGCRKPMTQGRV